jgi:hypothetical protein
MAETEIQLKLAGRTVRRVRCIAAYTNERLYEVVDRLVAVELSRLSLPEPQIPVIIRAAAE